MSSATKIQTNTCVGGKKEELEFKTKVYRQALDLAQLVKLHGKLSQTVVVKAFNPALLSRDRWVPADDSLASPQ